MRTKRFSRLGSRASFNIRIMWTNDSIPEEQMRQIADIITECLRRYGIEVYMNDRVYPNRNSAGGRIYLTAYYVK